MRGMINVLVTASGGDIGQGIIKSLKMSSYTHAINLITCDIHARAAGLFLGNKGYIVAPAAKNQKKYLDRIASICQKEKIHIAFICNEHEQDAIAAQLAKLRKIIKTNFVVQPLATLKICRDKLATYRFLTAHGIRCPETCIGKTHIEQLVKKFCYPIILKPRSGYAGVSNTRIITNARELLNYLRTNSDVIAQEHIANVSDDEYTVGVFLNNKSKSMGAISMLRKLRFSMTWHAVIDTFPDITALAVRAAETVGAVGPCNVQLRRDRLNQPCVIEINSRLSSTTVFRSHLGFNEAEASIDYFLKHKLPRLKQRKAVAMRIWDELIIPMDKYATLKNTGDITNG